MWRPTLCWYVGYATNTRPSGAIQQKPYAPKCTGADAEASARRKFDTAVLREAISAAVEAHGKGLILPKEMPIDPKTREGYVRYAPGFSSVPESGAHPYTVEALSKFLGFVKSGKQEPTNSFIAAFGAEELIADKVMTESQCGWPTRIR
jgi:hypothetical protein